MATPVEIKDPGSDVSAQVTENGLQVEVTQLPSGTDQLGTFQITPFSSVPKVGELAGSVTPIGLPDVPCKMVKFKAQYNNAGRVYLGGSGVTVAGGTTDTTTGFQLSAGEETGWIPIDNLNRFFRISDNAGDDLVYMALN